MMNRTKILAAMFIGMFLAIQGMLFWSFDMMPHENDGACPVLQVVGDCPGHDMFAVIQHHLSALQKLSEGMPFASAAFILVLGVLFVTALLEIFSGLHCICWDRSAWITIRTWQKFRHWLAMITTRFRVDNLRASVHVG